MLFNTLSYLLFLALVFCLYWASSPTARRWILLAASLAFYALWRIEFVFLIAFSAYLDYFFSLKIHDEKIDKLRKLWLLSSLSINLGLLAYFKYTYFLVYNLAAIGDLFGVNWHFGFGQIILPLGISFYTFLSISYTLDVYRREFTPIRNFLDYLTYVMYWPHMIAGPILRAHELIPQLLGQHKLKQENVVVGLKYILTGLFLKVGLADQLAPMIEDAFNSNPAQLGGMDVWTMAFAFGFQIYFDFAGYSMVAIGSALLFGVRFPENFDWPYLATSPREFWKRWHITLSSWIRDYLYVPLTGEKFRSSSHGGIDVQSGQPSSYYLIFALFVTWFLMGLWHGAGWKFALWGLWHATLILAYRLIKARAQVAPAVAVLGGWMVTQPLIMLGWLPFRAKSLDQSFQLLGRVLDIPSYASLSFRENFYLITALIFLGMITLWAIIHHRHVFKKWSWILDIGQIFGLTVMFIVVFVFLRPVNQFIYFQF